MTKLKKKSLQILPSFAEALDNLEHGKQQEAVNAALAMFYLSPPERRRLYVWLVHEVMDRGGEIQPREGKQAQVVVGSDRETEWWKDQIEKSYPPPVPSIFDHSDSSNSADTKKHTDRKKRRKSDATEVVRNTAESQPKLQRRRKEA